MEMENYIEPEFYKSVKLKIQKNVENIKKGKTEFEDLSALIYLKCKVLGIENYEKYKQVAIDEAQDYGDFSFYALKYLLKNATFSIFGDLAQSIYQYRGIRNWESVRNNTFNNNCEIKYLLKYLFPLNNQLNGNILHQEELGHPSLKKPCLHQQFLCNYHCSNNSFLEIYVYG